MACMESSEDAIYHRISVLNDELRGRCDTARIRYVSIEADPDFEGERLVLATWELPEPLAPDQGWPLELLDKYCELLADRLAGLASTECLFRTSEELVEDAKLGNAVPERV